MKTIILLSFLGVAFAAQLPVSQKQGKPLMYPGRSSKQMNQNLQCYEQPNQVGSSVRLIDYAENLGAYNFDNRASSCCFQGIWILYDQLNYNLNSASSAEFHAWGENYCTNFDNAFNKKASSARYVGAPESYKYDTLNLYDLEHFSGQEQFTYGDAPTFNIDNLGRSLIVTGCSPWSIYQYNNYQGTCSCVFPADEANCYPGFYETAASLGGLSQQISSARRGCFCAKKVQPSNAVKSGAFSHEGEFVPK